MLNKLLIFIISHQKKKSNFEILFTHRDKNLRSIHVFWIDSINGYLEENT